MSADSEVATKLPRTKFREVAWSEIHDFPATIALCMAWIVVFGAMLAHQAFWGGGLSLTQVFLGTANGLRFGALTLHDLYQGEVWRLLTATFVHFGVIHIAMNLYAMYQLGTLVESWYGSGPLVVIYVLTGGVGNLLSGLVRQALHSNPWIAAGGGSTVVMGLVALCAVVGWSTRTRTGDHLRNQMILVIALTAGLGIGFTLAGMPVIDNWGHAGGCVVGAMVGLVNGGMTRHLRGARAQLAGWLAVGILVASGAAQVAEERKVDKTRLQVAEAARNLARDQRLLDRLEEIRGVYRAVARPRAIMRGTLMRDIPGRPGGSADGASKPKGQPHPPPRPAGSEAQVVPPSPVPEPRKSEAKAKPEPEPEPARKSDPAITSPTSGTASAASAGSRPAAPIPLHLDPEQEFFVLVMSAAMRSLNSMGNDLQSRSSSADFHAARRILARTLSELPTLEEVREFDDHIVAIRDGLRADILEIQESLRNSTR